MDDELQSKWNDLRLSDDEKEEVLIEKDWVNEANQIGVHCLIGRLLIKKAINIESLKNVLSRAWKVENDITVKEVGDHTFIFHFGSIMDKDRVLFRQPWNFNKSLLVLNDFDGLKEPMTVNLDWCAFWVQIHGLPLGMMTERIGIAIGESLGDVEEVETCGEKVAWGKYLRVRILINATKPLKRRKLVALEGGMKIMVQFRYERLNDFCYVCGMMDHLEQDCNRAVLMMKEGQKITREYGPWLRAENPVFPVAPKTDKGPKPSVSLRTSSSSGSWGNRQWRNGAEGSKSVAYESEKGGSQDEEVNSKKGKSICSGGNADNQGDSTRPMATIQAERNLNSELMKNRERFNNSQISENQVIGRPNEGERIGDNIGIGSTVLDRTEGRDLNFNEVAIKVINSGSQAGIEEDNISNSCLNLIDAENVEEAISVSPIKKKLIGPKSLLTQLTIWTLEFRA